MNSPPRAGLAAQAATAAAGCAAALLLFAALRGDLLPGRGPAIPDGYVAAREGRATVYAASAGAAREGGVHLRHARERFRAVFGEEPAPLVVVLADDPAEFQELELRAFRRRGAGLLPFVTHAHLEALAARPGASATTIAREPEAAGAPVTMARVKPLAHEACHFYVARLADRWSRPAQGEARGYGHAALPDWFDEAAAVLCESEEGRAERRRHLRDRFEGRAPLRELERMPHPLGDREILARLGIDPEAAGTAVYHVSAEEARRLIPGLRSGMFYAQSHSLGEFLLERGGPRGMAAIAKKLARGSSLDDALARARRESPGLPGSLEALEAEWIRWVEAGGGG